METGSFGDYLSYRSAELEYAKEESRRNMRPSDPILEFFKRYPHYRAHDRTPSFAQMERIFPELSITVVGELESSPKYISVIVTFPRARGKDPRTTTPYYIDHHGDFVDFQGLIRRMVMNEGALYIGDWIHKCKVCIYLMAFKPQVWFETTVDGGETHRVEYGKDDVETDWFWSSHGDMQRLVCGQTRLRMLEIEKVSAISFGNLLNSCCTVQRY
jgi:hypothetical protein